MRFDATGFALAFALFAAPALADDTIKIGYIDPLSGAGASIGEVGLKTYQYLADEINASGGLLGKKVEIVAFDNIGEVDRDLAAGQDSRAVGRESDEVCAPGLVDGEERGEDRGDENRTALVRLRHVVAQHGG